MGRLVKTGSGTSQNGRLIRVGESTVKPYFQTAQKRTVTALPNAGTPTADRARLGLATGGNPVSDSLTRFTRERENEAMAVHNRDARVRAWTEAAAPELTGGELGALNRRLNSIGVERTALEQKQRASAAQANWNRTAAGRSRGLAAGAAEALFEKVSVERLLSERSVRSMRDLLAETLKQAGTEASEELLPQYYAAKNEATLRRMEGDGALKSLYAQAKGLREDLDRAALARDFARAVSDELVPRTMEAARRRGRRTIVAAGGVAANSVIRADLQAACDEAGCTLFVPPLALCGDNGAMIGAQGYYEYLAGRRGSLSLNAYATMDLNEQE